MDKIKENYQICLQFLTVVQRKDAQVILDKIKRECRKTTS